jgi:protein-tyrosine phosphatase
MNNNKQIKVLFVCMGNICRSPTAEGVFRHVIQQQGTADRFMVDSAGTHAYHVGEQPDRRAQQTARARGIDLAFIRARKVTRNDFAEFDYILAMDSDNYHNLLAICPAEYEDKVQLFLDYATNSHEQDVPDPYYGGQQGFEHVFDLVEDASHGFHNKVMNQ